MGAACTGAKAANGLVVDSVTLTREAKARLKEKHGSQPATTLKKTSNGRDGNVEDQDLGVDLGKVEREHESLWQAIESNSTQKAEAYLDKHEVFEASMFDSTGQSMLHRAAALGHTEIVIVLLERTDAKAEMVNQQLATPLHLACRSNAANVAKFLIGCGVDVNAQDEHGQTPLLICCIHGNADLVSILVESSIAGHLPEPLEVDLQDHRGLTPLNCAAIKGELEIVKALVTRGAAQVNKSSPKGCTPLIYAGRGGYAEVVSFLLKKASALKQDNAGGTVLHHCIEKGHLNVLEALLEHGVDVYSAIEIADNAGRTPLFEAVENMPELKNDDDSDGQPKFSCEIVKILSRKKGDGGFGAKVNVVNNSGQTPLFAAVREGKFEAVQFFVGEVGADVDLARGEVFGDEEEDEEMDAQEKFFYEAYKSSMTPLHIATILGYDHIALYLVKHGANVNYRTQRKGYTCLHLAVLANKPEMIIELLTNTDADPLAEDREGRSLLDLVYAVIPSYVESFQLLLEQLQVQRGEAVQNLPEEDNRHLTGLQEAHNAKMQELYEQKIDLALQEANAQEVDPSVENDDQPTQNKRGFADVEESDIVVEEGSEIDDRVESMFGRKVALGLRSVNWKFKELAMKVILKQTEKNLQSSVSFLEVDIGKLGEAAMAAVGISTREKVIKVFNPTLSLFNLLVSSSKLDQYPGGFEALFATIQTDQVVQKLLLKCEESNTRVTNKIHEALLDLSYHPKVGEELVAQQILELVEQHNASGKASNHKGLLAQLALLFKMINSFGVVNDIGDESATAAMRLTRVVTVILPALSHSNQDIRNASLKILLDVHRLTGSVEEAHLVGVPDKTREVIVEKLFAVAQEREESQKDQNAPSKQVGQDNHVAIVNIGQNESHAVQSFYDPTQFDKLKAIILEKGASKDWTQREIAVNSMQEYFENINPRDLALQEEFLTQCTIQLKQCLEENNISIYLLAVQLGSVFFPKSLGVNCVMEALPSLMTAVVLRTADTNTRVRKLSVDLIFQVWDQTFATSTGQGATKKRSDEESISSIIAKILVDPSLGEKAIAGRLGLFVKKALLIESADDLNKRPHQLLLGQDYEQLTEFACQWSSHKNTKVRQSALKLLVEVCRVNNLDSRGTPFKQRIINFILGLRPSLRDPLVKKINETCITEEGAPFINVDQMELNIATKHRSASMDVRGRKYTQPKTDQGLPSISSVKEGSLPTLSGALNAKPTIVLPHSEPLSDAQKKESQTLIDLFGLELMTCFYSQTWSTRQTALEKVVEQLQNLDPSRRDAMYGEINRNNLPPEVSFKVFLLLALEGFKDPVLNNYILVLEMIQKTLPIYFVYLKPDLIQSELGPIIQSILGKTSDLKSKVREASINFCLYLSHQSPVGPKLMITQVIELLNVIFAQKKETKSASTQGSATTNFGNSHCVASCLKLLHQFQLQTKIVDSDKSVFFKDFVSNINWGLKHQNPQVRKEAEALFKLLYTELGAVLLPHLKGQKTAVLQKLEGEVKTEKAQQEQSSKADEAKGTRPQSGVRVQSSGGSQQRSRFSTDILSSPQILALLQGSEETLAQLKLPNPQKRQKAIVGIKKALQKNIAQASSETAKQLLDPITLLLSCLLRDENAEVFLESLNLLKFVVGSLAPHLTQFDLHLMMSSFLGNLVSNSFSGNMRTQIASDKVVVYFAKHQNIGSLVLAKETLKNIERINKSLAQIAFTHTATGSADVAEELVTKRLTLSRYYSLLSMLMQQFSIVLCYQPEFYTKCLEHVADTLLYNTDEPQLKSVATQLVLSLFQIDSKLLEAGVNKLDFTRKTPLRKIMIEFENTQSKGRGVQVTDQFVARVGEKPRSPLASLRDTQQSFMSSTVMSPSNISLANGSITSGFNNKRKREWGTGNYEGWNNQDRNSEVRQSRKSNGLSTLEPKESVTLNSTSWLDRKRSNQLQATKDLVLPEIGSDLVRRRAPMAPAGFKSEANQRFPVPQNQQNVITNTSGLGGNLMQQSRDVPASPHRPPSSKRTPAHQTTTDTGDSSSVYRPPLYVPSRRGQSMDQNKKEMPQAKSAIQGFKSDLYQPSIGTSFAHPKPTLFGQNNSPFRQGGVLTQNTFDLNGGQFSFEASVNKAMPAKPMMPQTNSSLKNVPAAATFSMQTSQVVDKKQDRRGPTGFLSEDF